MLLKAKLEEYEKEIARLVSLNDDLKKSFINQNEYPVKKPYEIKESTKGFVKMVEPGWVSELLNKEPKSIIFDILYMMFLVLGDKNIPSVKNQNEFWNYISGVLKKSENNIGNKSNIY